MVKIADLLAKMEASPASVRFSELVRVCEHFFGPPRVKGSSHHVYKTPWPGDPRVNIQNHNGSAKPYQVRQVVAAIVKLRETNECEGGVEDEHR